MGTYTRDDIAALGDHIVSTYSDDIGADNATEMFREVFGALQSDSGKEAFTDKDIARLAEAYR